MPTDGLLKKTAIILAVMIGLTLGIGSMLPDEFQVERTLVVNASPDKVWPHISQLAKWPKWDPWSHADPQIQHKFVGEPGVGHMMHWAGPSSGRGQFETVESTHQESIGFKLTVPQVSEPRFLSFKLVDLGGKTQLTWLMRGENSIRPIGNYFGLGMDRYIGPMYEQGLSNLKSLIETGKIVLPKSDSRPKPVQ